MPRLSIIIPTLGNWEVLENTLVSVLQNRPARSEIIVVHSHGYHDPYDLKDEVRFVETASTRLVDLINVGLAASRTELIHVLACGAVVDDGWSTGAVGHFADSRVAAVAPLVVDTHSSTRILTAGCLWFVGGRVAAHDGRQPDDVAPANGRWIGPDHTAAFYRRSALCDVGSLDATLSPRLAAVDLGLRLLRAGYRAALETTLRVLIEQSLLDCDGPFRQAWQRERVFWRHARELGWWRTIAAHGQLLAGETLRSFPRWRTFSQLAGRLVGAFDRRSARLRPIEALPIAPVTSVERRVDAGHAMPPSQLGAGAAKTCETRSSAR